MTDVLIDCSDNELMKLHGSEQWPMAFHILYKRHQPNLKAYLIWLTGNPELSLDIVQQTFMKVFTMPQKFDHSKHFPPWLFVIAKNLWKNELRSASYEAAYKKSIVPHSIASTENKNEEKEKRLLLISQAVQLLNEQQREVFILKYKSNLNLAEIAQVQDCSIGTVKSRLFYALRHIKSHIQASSKKASL